MIPPAESARRLIAAALFGCALGLVYGFLRPLRKKSAAFGDVVFLLVFLFCLVELDFGVCGGDLRPWELSMVLLALTVWELTAGRLLRPLFFGFWGAIAGIFRPILSIGKKIQKKISENCKISLCIREKMGYNTMEARNKSARAGGERFWLSRKL